MEGRAASLRQLSVLFVLHYSRQLELKLFVSVSN